MNRLLGLIAVLGALIVAAPAAHATAALQCGDLAFDKGTTFEASNYGAGEITALRTNCAVARQVARGLKSKGGLAYSAHGFACKGTATSSEPGARKNWRCSRTVMSGKRPHRSRVRELVTFYSLGA